MPGGPEVHMEERLGLRVIKIKFVNDSLMSAGPLNDVYKSIRVVN